MAHQNHYIQSGVFFFFNKIWLIVFSHLLMIFIYFGLFLFVKSLCNKKATSLELNGPTSAAFSRPEDLSTLVHSIFKVSKWLCDASCGISPVLRNMQCVAPLCISLRFKQKHETAKLAMRPFCNNIFMITRVKRHLLFQIRQRELSCSRTERQRRQCRRVFVQSWMTFGRRKRSVIVLEALVIEYYFPLGLLFFQYLISVTVAVCVRNLSRYLI